MIINAILNKKVFSEKIHLDMFKKILTENLAAKNEKILIVGDKGIGDNIVSPILTNAYGLAAKELGLNYEVVYQTFKGRGDFADRILIKKMQKLPKRSIIIINISNRIGNLDQLGLSFRKFAKQQEHRFISSSSLGSISTKLIPLIIESLDIDYKKTEKNTKKIAEILTKGSRVEVTTKAGTNVTFSIKGVEAKTATGIYKNPGEGGNLPGSEAYIAPETGTMNGTIVIDGSLRILNETIIPRNPVRLTIKDGIITNINDNDDAKKLNATLMWAHNKAKNPEGIWRIGEFGIGLNKKAKIIGSTIIDEKAHRTAHFAIGSNAWFGGNIKAIIHLDQVIKDPTIKVDGKILKY